MSKHIRSTPPQLSPISPSSPISTVDQVFSPSSPRKRARVPSDETDPTSIESDNYRIREPSPQQRRSRKQVMTEQYQSSGSDAGLAWRWATGSISYPDPPMRTFAIEPNHPLVPKWIPLRDEIEAALDRSPIRWYAIEVFRRRRHIEKTQHDDTTVVITAKRHDEIADHWDTLKTTVQEICRAHGEDSLKVELIDGVIGHFAVGIYLEYDKVPTIGSSLGVTGVSWSNETLGGFVSLTKAEEKTIYCGLSCHHVLRPTKTRNSSQNASRTVIAYDPSLDQEGVYHPAVQKADDKFLIEQPSLSDYSKAQEELQVQLTDVERRLHQYQEKLEIGMDSASVRQGLKSTQETQAEYKRLLSDRRIFNRDFGHVWATSGYRVADRGCALDWGLVHVNENRKGLNKIPIAARSAVGQAPLVERTAGIDLGEEVVLVGRTSDVRIGIFNAIESRAAFPALERRTTEYVVTSRDGLAFAAPGDSGAFVLNRQGELMGLLIGGPLEKGQDGVRPTGAGYVTPIEAVFADIQAQTGYNVELPH